MLPAPGRNEKIIEVTTRGRIRLSKQAVSDCGHAGQGGRCKSLAEMPQQAHVLVTLHKQQLSEFDNSKVNTMVNYKVNIKKPQTLELAVNRVQSS